MADSAQLQARDNALSLPACTLAPNGLIFDGAPTDEALTEIGRGLLKIERGSPWWWGDFLCARIDRDMASEGKARGIEWEPPDDRAGRMRDAVRRYSQGVHIAEYTARVQLATASFFPLVSRRTDLSHTHHIEVWASGMTLEVACDWLARAADGHWSVAQLRASIYTAKHASEPQEPQAVPDVAREVSRMEAWTATRWPAMQTISPPDARAMLAQIPTVARLIDLLRASAQS